MEVRRTRSQAEDVVQALNSDTGRHTWDGVRSETHRSTPLVRPTRLIVPSNSADLSVFPRVLSSTHRPLLAAVPHALTGVRQQYDAFTSPTAEPPQPINTPGVPLVPLSPSSATKAVPFLRFQTSERDLNSNNNSSSSPSDSPTSPGVSATIFKMRFRRADISDPGSPTNNPISARANSSSFTSGSASASMFFGSDDSSSAPRSAVAAEALLRRGPAGWPAGSGHLGQLQGSRPATRVTRQSNDVRPAAPTAGAFVWSPLSPPPRTPLADSWLQKLYL